MIAGEWHSFLTLHGMKPDNYNIREGGFMVIVYLENLAIGVKKRLHQIHGHGKAAPAIE